MIIPCANDIAFRLFGFPVYYYGIIMAAAIFIAIICANYLFNHNNPEFKKDIILECAPIIIIMGIFGARLYFCCLNFGHYITNPLEILDIREGGLSIHGGIAGGILSILFIIKKYKISFWEIADPMAVATILGQAIGRWGNYFNSEAYGLPIQSNDWGLYIPPQHRVVGYENYELFHPAFLYESILDLSAFLILLFIFNKFSKKHSGLTFFTYLAIYSVIRFFIEFIRIDSALNIGSISIATIVSIILFITGSAGILAILKKTVSNYQ